MPTRSKSLHRLIFLLSVALSVFTVESMDASTWTDIQARKEIVWGADKKGGEPYVFENPDNRDQLLGFEVEIADELGKRMGVKPRFKHNDWSSLVPALERGDFDIVINGMEATSERRDRVLLSEPYFVYSETLAVPAGSKAQSLDDLKGKRIGTLNQTYAYDLLKQSGFDPSSYNGVYESDEEPYWDLANGKIDAVLLDNVIANRRGCGKKEIRCVPGEIGRGTYVILMRKGDDDLKAAVDRALVSMRTDGTLEKILRRWSMWDNRQTEPLPAIQEVHRSRSLDATQVKLFLQGAWTTLELSLASFVFAVTFGLLLATMRIYGGQPARFLAATYVEIFRGTPVLLQLYVLYFGIAPFIKLGAMQACILGLGLNYAAYESEIYRGAILSIARGQTEASHSLGLSHFQTLRYVILPQAFRIALPPMTNDFIALLKDSSLVGVIAVVELTKRMAIAATELRSWLAPGLLCAALYFLLSFPLALLARHLEKRMHRDRHP